MRWEKLRQLTSTGLIFSLMLTVFSATAIEKSDKNKLNGLLKQLSENNKAMLAIAVSEEGKTQYEGYIGKANIENQLVTNKETKFRIGSISKTFTAVMVLQLMEEGKLTLQTKLSRFFPDIAKDNTITIEQLLRHRSGLFNFTNDPAYESYMTQAHTRDQMLQKIMAFPLQFSPGEKFDYSNTNYILLSYIIEELSQDSYANQLQKRIVDKISLKNTYYGKAASAKDNEAYSYTFANGQWQLSPETDMSIPSGAGAIVSTVTDLNQFFHALFHEKLISKKSLNAMTYIQDRYGLGIMEFPFNGRQAFGHGGGIDGFVSNAAYFPEHNVAIAATSNGLNFQFNDLFIATLSAQFNEPFEVADYSVKPISLAIDLLQKYQGEYKSKSIPLEIKVFVENSQLFAQATGQGAFPLTAFSESQFTFEQAGIVIDFTVDKDAVNYSQFTLKQGGQQFLFDRK